MQRKGNMGPEIHWNVNQNQQTTTCWMGRTHLVSIGFSQQHPHTYCKTSLISVSHAHFEGKTEIPGDTELSHRTLSFSCGENIFPKEIAFLLWHCWRCTICKRKSENSHSRGDRLDWWSDESGAPLSQIWDREESEADPSAKGMIESSTGPDELNDTQPNTVWLLVPQTQVLTGVQPVKYQVKRACCTTGQLGYDRGWAWGGWDEETKHRAKHEGRFWLGGAFLLYNTLFLVQTYYDRACSITIAISSHCL